ITTASGVSYASSYAASLDIGTPYTANTNGGIQLSSVGVHLEGVTVTAISIPGKSVRFGVKANVGYVSVNGKKVVDLPPVWAPNSRMRIPEKEAQPIVADIFFNEQVTTDSQGKPTMDSNGKVVYDTKATSGYVNAIRMIINGKEEIEVTLLHAAVIRDPDQTDKFESNIPELPPFLKD
ncbi:hypothetical protein BGZ76_007663, partial [Entomortierella beljakovae]